jgi:hypothetical protein
MFPAPPARAASSKAPAFAPRRVDPQEPSFVLRATGGGELDGERRDLEKAAETIGSGMEHLYVILRPKIMGKKRGVTYDGTNKPEQVVLQLAALHTRKL